MQQPTNKHVRAMIRRGAGTLAAALGLAGCAQTMGLAPTPRGFDAYVVLMAAGVHRPADPDFVAPSGRFFQEVIMGRRELEIGRQRAKAVAFFRRQLGIDVLSTSSGVSFEPFMQDPREELRAYTVAGERVPREGLLVRNGGWKVEVIAPEGIELGGRLAGQHAPRGAILVFGDYNIRVSERVGRLGFDPQAIVIHYESSAPMVIDARGEQLVRLDVYSDSFGHGVAQGMAAPQMLSDGQRQANIRLVLTFPPYGWASRP